MAQKRKPVKKRTVKPTVAKAGTQEPKKAVSEKPAKPARVSQEIPDKTANQQKPTKVKPTKAKPTKAKPTVAKATKAKPSKAKPTEEAQTTKVEAKQPRKASSNAAKPTKVKAKKAAPSPAKQKVVPERTPEQEKQDRSTQATGPIDRIEAPQKASQKTPQKTPEETPADNAENPQENKPKKSKPTAVKRGRTAQSRRSKKEQQKKSKRVPKKRGHIWLRIALTIIIVCIVGSCAVLSWQRWFRFDDVRDVQGQWVDAKNTVEVTVDEKNIHLADDIQYSYELDTWAKGITFSFAELQGKAMYLFSQDRNVLYIVEGENRSLLTDFLRLLNVEEDPDYFDNEQATILVRASSGLTVKPRDDKEKEAPLEEEKKPEAAEEEKPASNPEETSATKKPDSSELTDL